MIVATNIQGEMTAKGMTPASLAREAKLNATGIYDIMSGKSQNPRLDTIQKIANALDVPISQLFEKKSTTEMISALLSEARCLSEVEQRQLVLTAQAWRHSHEAQ